MQIILVNIPTRAYNVKIKKQTVALSRALIFQKKNCFICFNESPLEMMKNAFYLISKALFVSKILKIFSSFFGHAEKTAWLEI